MEQLDDFLFENSGRVDGGEWRCGICGQSGLKTDIFRHIEARHVTLPYLYCDVCQVASKTRDSLKRHKQKYHRDNFFPTV